MSNEQRLGADFTIVGKWLAIVPPHVPSDKKKIIKIYSLLVLTVISVAVLSSVFFRLPVYQKFLQIKLIISILIQASSYAFTVNTILGAIFWKQNQWFILMENLLNMEAGNPKSCNKLFYLPQAAFWIFNCYVIYLWSDILGFVEFFAQYFIDVVLFYYQFFYTCVILVVTSLLNQKYKNICQVLKTQKIKVQVLETDNDRKESIKKLVEYVRLPNETVNIFNEIFGWPILLLIFNSSLVTMDYLDDMCKNSFEYKKAQYVGVIISNMFTISFCLFPTFTMIISCDVVIQEYRHLLTVAYNVRYGLEEENRRQITRFIKVATDSFPRFSAAGFFLICKSTIFHILGTTATYLIVMLQFNASSREQLGIKNITSVSH